ncbi:MAG: GntR family transcriptional regulator [Clostridiaceae bacterium]
MAKNDRKSMDNKKLGEVLSIKLLVYNNLRKRIISGELPAGTRLLELELAEEMDISRAPIREAFNMLEKDGFVKIMPRKGVVVSETTIDDIYAIWEMRMLIEPYAARITLDSIPSEEIEELYREIVYVGGHPDEFERYMESDLKLHDLISKYLDNSYMKATLDNLKAHSLRIRWSDEYTAVGVRHPETPEAVNEEHLKIAEAMKKRDHKQIQNAVHQHIFQSISRVLNASGLELTQEQRSGFLNMYAKE